MKSRWINHKQTKIFYIDFANFEQDLKPFEAEFEAISSVVRLQPKRSVLGLVDLHNTVLSIEATGLIKGYAPQLSPYIGKAAVVFDEISGFKKVIFSAIARVGGREIILFDNIETAKNWLIEDQ